MGQFHECFAEFCRFYFTGYTNQDWARALEILCPNQYALFKRVRMDYLDGYTLWYDGPEKQVTVTLDYNDGGKTAPKTIVVDQYSLYSENIGEDPAWKGHEFLGWFTDAEGGSQIGEKQRVINEEEHTLYAHWKDTSIYPESVTLNETEITLTEGEHAELTAAVHPDDATDKTLTWKSTDEAVVTVDENGNLKAVAPGTAEITVTTVNGKTASCTVTVQAAVQKNSDTPNTGDRTEPAALLAVTVICGSMICVLLHENRKRISH